MKTTTLLKSLFLAIALCLTSLVYAQDKTSLPEVTTMEEVITIFVLCVLIGLWGLESKRNNDDNDTHRGGA